MLLNDKKYKTEEFFKLYDETYNNIQKRNNYSKPINNQDVDLDILEKAVNKIASQNNCLDQNDKDWINSIL